MVYDLAIRDVRSTDAEAIADIAIAAWNPIYAFYRQTLCDELFAAVHPKWQQEKARPVRTGCDPHSEAMVCVAEKQGCVVGFITLYADTASGIGELGNNAVHPDFQGMGIGTRMYRYVFARLRQLGMGFVKVSTGGDPAHAPARRAYQKPGFCVGIPSIEYYRRL